MITLKGALWTFIVWVRYRISIGILTSSSRQQTNKQTNKPYSDVVQHKREMQIAITFCVAVDVVVSVELSAFFET